MADNDSNIYWAPLKGKVVGAGDDRIFVQRSGDKGIYAIPTRGQKNNENDLYYPAMLVCTPEPITEEMRRMAAMRQAEVERQQQANEPEAPSTAVDNVVNAPTAPIDGEIVTEEDKAPAKSLWDKE